MSSANSLAFPFTNLIRSSSSIVASSSLFPKPSSREIARSESIKSSWPPSSLLTATPPSSTDNRLDRAVARIRYCVPRIPAKPKEKPKSKEDSFFNFFTSTTSSPRSRSINTCDSLGSSVKSKILSSVPSNSSCSNSESFILAPSPSVTKLPLVIRRTTSHFSPVSNCVPGISKSRFFKVRTFNRSSPSVSEALTSPLIDSTIAPPFEIASTWTPGTEYGSSTESPEKIRYPRIRMADNTNPIQTGLIRCDFLGDSKMSASGSSSSGSPFDSLRGNRSFTCFSISSDSASLIGMIGGRNGSTTEVRKANSESQVWLFIKGISNPCSFISAVTSSDICFRRTLSSLGSLRWKRSISTNSLPEFSFINGSRQSPRAQRNFPSSDSPVWSKWEANWSSLSTLLWCSLLDGSFAIIWARFRSIPRRRAIRRANIFRFSVELIGRAEKRPTTSTNESTATCLASSSESLSSGWVFKRNCTFLCRSGKTLCQASVCLWLKCSKIWSPFMI